MGDHPDGRSIRFRRPFWVDVSESEAMMVAAWLGCGTVAATVAWSGRPHAYHGGRATALAAGLCGGFLGGAFVILVARRHGVLPLISVYGATVGAIVMLDLAQWASGSAEGPAGSIPMGWLWSWACLIGPLLLAALIGITLGARTRSPALGVLIGVAAMPLLYWQRNRGTIGRRKWREYRG
jgi:hypothetical protein